jgi:hypothetical protein
MSEDSDRSHIGEFLARSRVLGVLAPEDRARLSEQCVGRQFAKNQVVYVAGGAADSMLVLTSGELKVSNYSADGAELILALVLPGRDDRRTRDAFGSGPFGHGDRHETECRHDAVACRGDAADRGATRGGGGDAATPGRT